MNLLQQIGLVTLIVLGILFLNWFLDGMKRQKRETEESTRLNNEAMVKAQASEELRRKRKTEEEVKAIAITEKQNAFIERWKNVSPEEEYLIRVGKVKSPLFNPELYRGMHPKLPPWGSSVENEQQVRHPERVQALIKVEHIVETYGLSTATLALLYRGYSNEYHSEERKFSADELSMDCNNWFASTPVEKAKINRHQITLSRIVRTIDELKAIAISENRLPVYQER